MYLKQVRAISHLCNLITTEFTKNEMKTKDLMQKAGLGQAVSKIV